MRWLTTVVAATAVVAVTLVATLSPDTVAAGTEPGIVHDDVVVEQPTQGTPQVRDGKVWAIAEWGDLVIVGGEFSTVKLPGGTEITRNNIFAFSKSTNEIDTRFAPDIDKSVRALAIDPDGRGLFVGGFFTSVNGEARAGLVFLDRDGDRVRNWSGRPNGQVSDLAVLDRTLYVGGIFSRVSGVDIDAFASVDVGTGDVTGESTLVFSEPRYSEFQGRLEIRRFEISADGQRLVVLGNFQLVDGQPRDQVAVVDVGSSPDGLVPWSTTWLDEPCNGSTTIWPYFVRDVSISPDGSYFAVTTVGGLQDAPPNPCDQVMRFEMANGLNQDPTWISYSGGDSVLSVEATGAAIYVGGHFRWMNNPFGRNTAGPGAIERQSLAALDPATGTPFDWNPGRQPRGHGVLVMEATEDGLWIGHDTDFVNNSFSPRLTHFSLPNPPPPTTTTTVPPTTTVPTTTTPPTTTTQPVGNVVVYNTDFGAGNGWVTDLLRTDTATTGLWEAATPELTSSGVVLQRGDVTSGTAALVTGRIAGTGVGFNDVDSGVTTAWSPVIPVPAGAGSVELSFDWYFGHLNNAGSDDFFRVEIVDAGVVSTVLSVPGSAVNQGAVWISESFDMSSFAGRNIRLRASAADNGTASLIEAGMDSVRIEATFLPTTTTTQPPTTTTQPPTTTTTQPPTTTTQPPTTTTTQPPTTTTTQPPPTTTQPPPPPFVNGAVVEITSAAFPGARLAESAGDAVTTEQTDLSGRWTLVAAGTNRWYLQNNGNNTYLDGDSGGIDVFFFQGSDRVWQFEDAGNGRYRLRNIQFGRLVEATSVASPVIWDSGSPELDDEWIVTRVG